jgi:hypothetical protein
VGFGCIWIVGLLVVFFVVANILGLSLVFLAYRSVLCFFCVWNEKSYSSKKKKKFCFFPEPKEKTNELLCPILTLINNLSFGYNQVKENGMIMLYILFCFLTI